MERRRYRFQFPPHALSSCRKDSIKFASLTTGHIPIHLYLFPPWPSAILYCSSHNLILKIRKWASPFWICRLPPFVDELKLKPLLHACTHTVSRTHTARHHHHHHPRPPLFHPPTPLPPHETVKIVYSCMKQSKITGSTASYRRATTNTICFLSKIYHIRNIRQTENEFLKSLKHKRFSFISCATGGGRSGGNACEWDGLMKKNQ